MNLKRSKPQWAVTILLPVLILSCLMPVNLGAQTEAGTHRAASSADSTPAVLVELFTSEGCSSCPPADKLLAELDRDQRIPGITVIALSQHVDYWNRLGWRDPFSSAEFSRRQMAYAQALGIKDFYTPQMIVDGRTEFVGSHRATALEAIARAAHSPKATITLAIKPSTPDTAKLTIQIENVPADSPNDKADVMLAVAESALKSKVNRGENSGRELAHSSVTRRLTRVAALDGTTFQGESGVRLDPTWKRQNTKIVVFVQERASRHVLGAASINLAVDP